MAFLDKNGYFDQINDIKTVFEEERETAVFQAYSNHILVKKKPAILFCVMGGRLSEGINFSDDLARTLLIIGLPYANSQSHEIRERTKFWDKEAAKIRKAGKAPTYDGHEYYTNLCMKQVNQAIGRAVRHVKDHAIVFLVDQ